MPCLAVAIALAAPRLLVALLWLFTGWFTGIFSSLLWPVLGFVLAPTSLLWYAAVQHWFGGQWSLWPSVGMAVAVMIDLSPARNRRARRRD